MLHSPGCLPSAWDGASRHLGELAHEDPVCNRYPATCFPIGVRVAGRVGDFVDRCIQMGTVSAPFGRIAHVRQSPRPRLPNPGMCVMGRSRLFFGPGLVDRARVGAPAGFGMTVAGVLVVRMAGVRPASNRACATHGEPRPGGVRQTVEASETDGRRTSLLGEATRWKSCSSACRKASVTTASG